MASKSGSKRGRKDKGVAPSDSSTPAPNTRFIDGEASAKYSLLRNKKIKYGRIIDHDSHLNAYGLNVQTLLEFQGLDNFLGLSMGVFPVLVKEFYANLRHPSDARGKLQRDTLISRVNYIDIEFNESKLASIFELDHSDDQLDIFSYSDIATHDPTFDLLAALNTICEVPRLNTDKVKTVELSLPCRIIHRIIIHAINPRSGSYDQVPKMDAYLVSAVWSQKKINWAGFLFNLFKKGTKRKDANLLFGIALSKLFYVFEVVGNSETQPHTIDDYFTETTIQRFGYEIQNGVWVKKGGALPQDEPGDGDDSMGEDDEQEPQQQTGTHPSSSTPSQPTNFELMQAIQELGLHTRQDIHEMRQDIHLLRQDVRRIDFHISSFREAFQAQWPDYIFPQPPPDAE